jgi:hypothetical protein
VVDHLEQPRSDQSGQDDPGQPLLEVLRLDPFARNATGSSSTLTVTGFQRRRIFEAPAAATAD